MAYIHCNFNNQLTVVLAQRMMAASSIGLSDPLNFCNM